MSEFKIIIVKNKGRLANSFCKWNFVSQKCKLNCEKAYIIAIVKNSAVAIQRKKRKFKMQDVFASQNGCLTFHNLVSFLQVCLKLVKPFS